MSEQQEFCSLIGYLLQESREQQNLSRTMLCQKMNKIFSANTLYLYEKGYRELSLYRFKIICDALEIRSFRQLYAQAEKNEQILLQAYRRGDFRTVLNLISNKI